MNVCAFAQVTSQRNNIIAYDNEYNEANYSSLADGYVKLVNDEFISETGKKKYIIKFKNLADPLDPNKSRFLEDILSRVEKEEKLPFEFPLEGEAKATGIYLKDKYKINSKISTSKIINSAVAYLDEDQAKALFRDEIVDFVIPDKALIQSGWSDYDDNIEIASWALLATNTHDNYNGINPVFIADMALPRSFALTDVNITQEGADYSNIGGTTWFEHATYHPVYISSIIGAKRNSTQTRGVNPGTPIKNFTTNLYQGTITVSKLSNSIERAYNYAEANNIFGVLSLSQNNATSGSHSEYWSDSSVLGQMMAIASNRLFISQSAGNLRGSACNHAFTNTAMLTDKKMDGIMIVGGYDSSGAYAQGFIDGNAPTPNDAGSNYGNCVDAWAPAKNIWVSSYPNTSDFYNFDSSSHYPYNSVKYNSVRKIYPVEGGTSYAAPIVAAIAARVGSNVRPPAREAAIFASLQNTGFSDPAGFPIKSARYNTTTNSQASGYLSINNIYSNQSVNLQLLKDGRFDNGFWNANGYSGTLEFDVSDTVYGVDSMRLTPRNSAYGPLSAKISYTNGDGNYVVLSNKIYYSYDRYPIAITFPRTRATRFKLEITTQNSWTALSEVEFYGR